MRPTTIAVLIIVLIVVVKDPKILTEIINGIVAIFNSGPNHG